MGCGHSIKHTDFLKAETYKDLLTLMEEENKYLENDLQERIENKQENEIIEYSREFLKMSTENYLLMKSKTASHYSSHFELLRENISEFYSLEKASSRSLHNLNNVNKKLNDHIECLFNK